MVQWTVWVASYFLDLAVFYVYEHAASAMAHAAMTLRYRIVSVDLHFTGYIGELEFRHNNSRPGLPLIKSAGFVTILVSLLLESTDADGELSSGRGHCGAVYFCQLFWKGANDHDRPN